MYICCSLASSFRHEGKPHRCHHKKHWLNTNTYYSPALTASVWPLTRKHISKESMMSHCRTTWVVQEEDKHSKKSNSLEYNATSSAKLFHFPFARKNIVHYKQKPNSENYWTPLHSCSCVVTRELARVTSSSPCKGLETLHIPNTLVAFPLVGSRAEKSVAWMDQTVTSLIIYSLFSVDPGSTVSHSKPWSNSLLACVTILSLAPAPLPVQPYCQFGLITENKSWKKQSHK